MADDIDPYDAKHPVFWAAFLEAFPDAKTGQNKATDTDIFNFRVGYCFKMAFPFGFRQTDKSPRGKEQLETLAERIANGIRAPTYRVMEEMMKIPVGKRTDPGMASKMASLARVQNNPKPPLDTVGVVPSNGEVSSLVPEIKTAPEGTGEDVNAPFREEGGERPGDAQKAQGMAEGKEAKTRGRAGGTRGDKKDRKGAPADGGGEGNRDDDRGGDRGLHTDLILTIHPALRDALPPLDPEEMRALEESLLADGCRDPLVVWKGRNILVEGHHRYQLCAKHGIPVDIIEKDFEDEDDAIIWILKNQLARRNLPAHLRARLALHLKPLIAERAKERQRGGQGGVLLPANLPKANTREDVAALADLSPRTIDKVEIIEEYATPEEKAKLDTGEESITSLSEKVNPKKKEKPKMTGVEITIRWLTTNTYEKFRCSDETGEEIKGLLSEEE
jgi:hypothetical protein